MKHNNNFNNPQVVQKSLYKLRIYYKPGSAPFSDKVYYSHERPGNPNFGLRKLMALLKEPHRRPKIDSALLIDNQTNQIIQTFNKF